VDGRRGSDQDGVEEADGLGPVAGAAEARELGAVGSHGGGGGRSPAAGGGGRWGASATSVRWRGGFGDLGGGGLSMLLLFPSLMTTCSPFTRRTLVFFGFSVPLLLLSLLLLC